MSNSELNARKDTTEEHNTGSTAKEDSVSAEELPNDKIEGIDLTNLPTVNPEGKSADSQSGSETVNEIKPIVNDQSSPLEQIDLEMGSNSSEAPSTQELPNTDGGDDHIPYEQTESWSSHDPSQNITCMESVGKGQMQDNEDVKQTNDDEDDTGEVVIGSNEEENADKSNSTTPILNNSEYQEQRDRRGSDSSSTLSNGSQKHDNERETSATPIDNDNGSTDIGVETNNGGSIINESSITEDNYQHSSESVESVRGSPKHTPVPDHEQEPSDEPTSYDEQVLHDEPIPNYEQELSDKPAPSNKEEQNQEQTAGYEQAPTREQIPTSERVSGDTRIPHEKPTQSSEQEPNYKQASDNNQVSSPEQVKEEQWPNSGLGDSDHNGSTVSEASSLEIVSNIDQSSNSTMEGVTTRQTRYKTDRTRKGKSNPAKPKKQQDISTLKSSDTSQSAEVTTGDKTDSYNGNRGTTEVKTDKAGSEGVQNNQNEHGHKDHDQTSTTETNQTTVSDTKYTEPTEEDHKDEDTPRSQHSQYTCDGSSARSQGDNLNSTDTQDSSRTNVTERESENTTKNDNDNPQQKHKRGKPKPKSVRSIIKKELKLQLSSYINEDRRLLAFDPKGEKASFKPPGTKKRKAAIKKSAELKFEIDPATPISANELNRLVKTAGKMLNETELEEIWNFHQFRVGKKLDRSPRNGYVQNYSRHFGSILRSNQYQQFYGGLYGKPDHNEKQTTE